jgi:hypothetical protein
MDTPNIIALIASLGTLGAAIVAWLDYKNKRKSSGDKNHSEQSHHTKIGTSTGNTIVIPGKNSGPISNVFVNKSSEFEKINFTMEDERNEWKIYEVAFLWHEIEPPSASAHFNKMTRKVEETKNMLHQAIDNGTLVASKEIKYANGFTRYVTRKDLVNFCEKFNYKPSFLFPSERK